MAYLVRRLLENTSNESFLYEQARGRAARGAAGAARGSVAAPDVKPFAQRADPRAAAGAGARAARPTRCERIDAEPPLQRAGLDRRRRARRATSSSRPTPASPTASSRRPRSATRGRRRRGAGRRAARRRAWGPHAGGASAPRCCMRAAAWLRERRLEVAALEVRECAKPWREADADVCEAIDFLEYYARAAVALEHPRRPAPTLLIQLPGRAQHAALAPARRRRRDLAVELPGRDPAAGWSPPALATGNAVVLKPAEQAPGCAYMLVRGAARGRRAAGRARAAARRGRRSAPRWSATRACTRSPSPARARSGWRSCAAPPRCAPGPEAPQARRGRDGRQELRDRGLRRRPRRRRPRAREVARSTTRARSARPPRACSPTRRSTTRCVERLGGRGRGARRRPGGATRRSTSRR